MLNCDGMKGNMFNIKALVSCKLIFRNFFHGTFTSLLDYFPNSAHLECQEFEILHSVNVELWSIPLLTRWEFVCLVSG